MLAEWAELSILVGFSVGGVRVFFSLRVSIILLFNVLPKYADCNFPYLKKEKKTKIALNQVFVLKLAFKAKSHKNSTQEVGFRV